jgi:hypothetical protein
MSRSLNQITYRRDLKGYVVLLRGISEGRRANLALNFGPCLGGKGWGFDWPSRATVFRTMMKAYRAVKEYGNLDRRDIAILAVKDFAYLVPEVDMRGRVRWYAEPIDNVKGIQERVAEMLTASHKLEASAKKDLKRVSAMRRAAGKLCKLPAFKEIA